ncbi:MAG TPA: methionine gamma-lyase family protein, partial [Candidatus Xenobia bacterium]
PGSLEDRGIRVSQVDLDPHGMIDAEALVKALTPDVRAVFLQRSRGYDWRPSHSCDTLQTVIRRLKASRPDVWVLVDNCYGEMVEKTEPTQRGADAVAGSLIKNLGGGICPTGGYIAGRKDLVAGAARAITAPGIEGHVGATLGVTRILSQGIFLSPLVVNQALTGAMWAGALLEARGYEVSPRPDDPRTDIIQAIRLGTPEKLLAFCRGIQSAGAVDSRAVPHPVMNPGYRDPIVMAGGTFIQGSSIELSADGPLREPYAVYLQGGLSFSHVKTGVLAALEAL